MSRILLLLTSCLVLLLLAGCGNKGLLVLPPHPATPSTVAAPTSAAPVNTPR
ncbi:sugar transporter [Rhodanobacter sp. AS-Z3]|uniref:LPS translocon maturation chaperone LptM n=1 Tax=Rhodanobacter sp. AS-Z3 TaxID=3031330 RepID=UPI00247AE874|nr:sugar transporter [Rhodanobacter sp. AS-Z3]WEN15497.1 sugar transporter [Rhodanobacter sp. AS-Z3]